MEDKINAKYNAKNNANDIEFPFISFIMKLRRQIRMEKVTYVPLTDLNRGKASKIIDTLKKKGQSVFIVKNNKPEAVMISMKDYEEFREYMFYKEVQRRAMAYAAEPVMTYSRDDVMKEYDITEEDLKEVDDEVEFDYD